MHRYLDHNATTPLLPEARAAMLAALDTAWGNPSSLHGPGRAAREQVETAREQVASLWGVATTELLFTGGGTESCHLAVTAAARAHVKIHGAPGHALVSGVEHAAMRAAVEGLAESGWAVEVVPPDADGTVRPAAVEAMLRPDTGLCAVLHANNETGVVQPAAALGALLRARGVAFVCDMSQSLGKLEDASPARVQADYAVCSAHKIGGPKGVGALYIRKGLKPEALVRGGGQERGLRGGTENVPGILGFGAAAAWWQHHGASEHARLGALRDALQAALVARVPGLRVTAPDAPRLPNTLHVTFPPSPDSSGSGAVRGDVLVMALDLRGIAVSAGSACASGSVKPSEVLRAMGYSTVEAAAALRFSLGAGNGPDDVEPVADATARAVADARAAAGRATAYF